MGEIIFGKSFGLIQNDEHPVLGWLQNILMLGVYVRRKRIDLPDID
jgi:hypothetical protein